MIKNWIKQEWLKNEWFESSLNQIWIFWYQLDLNQLIWIKFEILGFNQISNIYYWFQSNLNSLAWLIYWINWLESYWNHLVWIFFISIDWYASILSYWMTKYQIRWISWIFCTLWEPEFIGFKDRANFSRSKIQNKWLQKALFQNMMIDPVHSTRICHTFIPISIFLQNLSMKKLYNTPTV